MGACRATLRALLFASLTACGARSEIVGAGGAGETSAASSSSAGADGGPCTWRFGEPVLIASNATAKDAVNDEERIVVSLEAEDARSELVILNRELAPLGPPVDLGPNLLGSLAFGFGRRVVLGGRTGAWTHEGRCAVVSLDASDRPLGPPTAPFADDGCFWPVATPSGTLVFWRHYPDPPVEEAVTTFSVDAAGHALGEHPNSIPAESMVPDDPSAKAALADGSVLTIWAERPVLYVKRFAPDGSPLGGAKPLGDSDAFRRIDMLSRGSSALVAWSGVSHVRTATLDADGDLGPVHVFPGSTGDELLQLVATTQGMLLVENVDVDPLCACEPGAGGRFVVRPLDATGAATSTPVRQVLRGKDYRLARVVPSGAGAVVIMNAEVDTVWATRLDCSP